LFGFLFLSAMLCGIGTMVAGRRQLQQDAATWIPPAFVASRRQPLVLDRHQPNLFLQKPSLTKDQSTNVAMGASTAPLPPRMPAAALSMDLGHLGVHLSNAACAPGLPGAQSPRTRACQELRCLWSESKRQNVDVWRAGMAPLPVAVATRRCVTPTGGQRRLPTGTRPQITFIFDAMQGRDDLAAASLQELFRVAHEVESAAYVVLSEEEPRIHTRLGRLLQDLKDFFGVAIQNLLTSSFKASLLSSGIHQCSMQSCIYFFFKPLESQVS
jgi:hypothetical protein